jgi:hypothetical protein
MAKRAVKLGWCSVRITLPVCLAGEKYMYISSICKGTIDRHEFIISRVVIYTSFMFTVLGHIVSTNTGLLLFFALACTWFWISPTNHNSGVGVSMLTCTVTCKLNNMIRFRAR